MVGKENWVFGDYCSQKSKLGLLLFSEVKKIEKKNIPLDDEQLRVTALINLGKTIGCEIKPFDFLGLGAHEYLRIRKDVRDRVRKRIDLAEMLGRKQTVNNW